MQIKSIAAKNYRTLKDTTLSFSNSYCTISGKNNAGKSCVIRLLSALFRSGPAYPWAPDEGGFDYKEDRTQWVDSTEPISVAYELLLTKAEDPALISFIEKISTIQIAEPSIVVTVTYVLNDSDSLSVAVKVGDESTDDKAAKEIDKRIKDSNLLFLYNSTTRHEEIYLGRGRRRMFYELIMSEDEKKELVEASKQVEKRIRRLANEHKLGLSGILGRLTERYDVEFSPLEGYSSRRMPLGINLRDKHVEVPLNDWGSGTQNRTHILMAVLQANRIKTTESPDDKITPFVVIEEPESFLHPAAQAEFGRLLRTLSSELEIQILVTTHSPYMLNQERPVSNILLAREFRRNKYFETCVVDTAGDNWMAPFAEHLGIAPTEFMSWRPVFSSYKSKVLLVEGPIDQQYFEFLQKKDLGIEPLSPDIEVVPYGGKDTLKNTLLVQFVLRKFDHVFVTYDLDADGEIKGALHRLGLKETKDYLALGVKQAGKDCIEGVLPQCVLATVMGKETDLAMRLGSRDNSERRKAKDELKRKYLEEFKKPTDYSKEELKELSKIIRIINGKLA
jgi:predicted ATP-dependent endonuclease of OLD family